MCSTHQKQYILVLFCIYSMQVFSWGYNGNGELGIGSTANKSSPEEVTNLQNHVITKVCKYACCIELTVGPKYVCPTHTCPHILNLTTT